MQGSGARGRPAGGRPNAARLPLVDQYARRVRARLEYARASRRHPRYDVELSFRDAMRRFGHPNESHAYMHHYFHQRAPAFIREHRRFFREGGRGFGEDALHAMWWLILLQYRPRRLLEIGVYRGQVISLWARIAKFLNDEAEVHGISPFSPVGDSVSVYRSDLDYEADVRRTFRRFGLPDPVLVRALSTDPVAVEHIQQRSWDVAYIDGSHEYETVLADYTLCRKHLAPGGLLILDDAAVASRFRPPAFSFAGHEGPSRVASEVASKEMRLLGFVGHNAIFEHDA